jgi:hypothetical protein
MNNETLTSGIKHWGLSGYASVLPRIKFGVTGQEIDRAEGFPFGTIGNFSYRQTLAVMLKRQLR